MAQLRLAMAQVNPIVGDLAGNARMVRERWTEAAAGRSATSSRSPRWCSPAYPVEDLALRESFVEATPARPGHGWPPTSPPTGYGDLPVVVGYLDRAARAERSTPDPGRTLPQNCCRGPARRAGRRPATPSTTCRTTASSTSSGSSRPARDLTVVRVRGVDVAIAICEDLWQEGGPVAQTRDAGAELLLVLNGSPYERDKDDVRLRAGAPAGRTGRVHAGLPQPGRRPGRAGLRRGLDRGRLRRARCSRGRRSSTRTCSSSTWTCRRRRVDDPPTCRRACVHVVLSDEPVAAVCPRAAPIVPALDPVGEVYHAARARAAGLRAQERVPSVSCSGSPAASTRRSSRRVAADALGRRERRRRVDAEPVLRSTPRTTRPSWRRAPGWTTGSCRSSRWSSRSSARPRADRRRRGEPAGARAAASS